jgi:hypothetical protein
VAKSGRAPGSGLFKTSGGSFKEILAIHASG